MESSFANSSLESQVQTLQAQLAQCHADKDFVWSLWKRLQVASPDITQAITMVVQRENEKAEAKDRQVLQILQLKDDQLDGLRRAHAECGAHVTDLTNRISELDQKTSALSSANADLKDVRDKLQDKVEDLERNEQSSARRHVVDDMEKKTAELKQTLSDIEQKSDAQSHDNIDLQSVRDVLKDRVQNLDRELAETSSKHGQLMQEHMQQKNSLQACEKELNTALRENEAKNRELEAVRMELSEIWTVNKQQAGHSSQQADLIRQLQALHSDTKTMLKNQENTYNMELSALRSNLQASVEKISNLHQQIKQHVQTIAKQDSVITELQEGSKVIPDYDRDEKSTQASSDDDNNEILERRMQGMRDEIEMLKRDRVLRMSRRRPRSVSPEPIKIPSSKSPKTRRALPMSADRMRHRSHLDEDGEITHEEFDAKILREALAKTQGRLERTQTLLQMRVDELRELKDAHGKRLDRLKALQTDHRLLRKQFKIVEQECYGPRKKRKRLQRSHPKSLQKEDSDGVWNELAYFKQANRALAVEKMNLQEEVDKLRVQVVQDVATIYELRTCLEQEREELQFVVGQQEESRTSTPRKGEQEQDNRGVLELQKYTQKLTKLSGRVNRLLEENKRLATERLGAEEERRSLQSEVNSLRQMDAEHRIEKANLTKKMIGLRKDLRRKRHVHVKRKSGAHQYQRILNHSIQQMSQLFRDFDHDGWEEIPDTEETTNEEEEEEADSLRTDSLDVTASTVDSLGQAIADRATMVNGPVVTSDTPRRAQPSARQLESVDDHVSRISRKQEMPKSPLASPVKASLRLHDAPLHDPCRHCASTACTVPQMAPLVPAAPRVVSTKVGGSKVNAGAANARQVATLKQRIKSLQQQVKILKCVKDSLSSSQTEHKATVEHLQGELQANTQKLQHSRAAVQRLTAEVERLRDEQGALQNDLEEERSDQNASNLHLEQDWLNLTSRLRNVSAESSKQLAQIKQLKATNAGLNTKVEQLEDRVNHQERDVSQKRQLVEEMRTKLKAAQDAAKSDCQIMSDIEGKFKVTIEANSRYKIQLDALRQRLSSETRDKYENENKVIKLSEELEKKARQSSDLQRRVAQLESSLGAVEMTAREQLAALANQSEAAIDTAQSRLLRASSALREFNKFVALMGRTLLLRVQKARSLHSRQQRHLTAGGDTASEPGSLRRARDLASDLLNLGSDDVEDLLSVDGESSEKDDSEERKDLERDKKWSRKWQKILQTQENFADSIVDLFMEKMDERNELSSRLGSGI